MIRRPRSPWASRSGWLVVAVVALLARIGSPPGTMLTQTARGPQLVLCSGHGPMSMPGMTMPKAAMAKTAPPAHSQPAGGCEFAAHAATALTPASLELVGSQTFRPAPAPAPIVLTTTGSGLAAPPPPSRGPPVLLV